MESSLEKDRAWLEIDLLALRHNVEVIQRELSSKTKMMAVVKGNAYGHGLVAVSKYLNKIGITDFAVSTLEEGMTLRKNGIIGNILILGYTSIQNIKYVKKYQLIQTIIDFEYAKKLFSLKETIEVYIKINTGMNRIGISYQEIEKISKIYEYPNLKVLGLFSHLSSSEQYIENDITYTKLQIKRLQIVVDSLKEKKIEVGKIHLQSSYGFMNYPELEYDYVRIGMILYGIHSEYNRKLKRNLELEPILSLKARVSSVNLISKGEYVGYDRTFKADSNRKIATLSIGYADGYPRSFSNGVSEVLIGGNYVPIIGRICMDQLMIDVTGIEVKQGDIATLIGREEKIRADYLAYHAGTITNELLSRLGARLRCIYLEKK